MKPSSTRVAMNPAEAVNEIANLGDMLGFAVDPEHWTRDNPGDAVYRPRIDCLWAVDLAVYGYDTSLLDDLVGPRLASPYGLIGFEVEANKPTTKSQFSNLANLGIAAIPYSVLVVNVAAEEDAFRRANRVVRTFNRRFGFRSALALDISCVPQLRSISPGPLLAPSTGPRLPAKLGQGGEREWAARMRGILVHLGQAAGFEVTQDVTDPGLASSYSEAKKVGPEILDVAWSPTECRRAQKAGDLFTDSKPDVVWNVRTGPGLSMVVNALASQTPASRSLFQSFGPVPELLPVATFEIESSMDKHGAGAVLTLAARPGIGVVVTKGGTRAGERVVQAYRPIIGASNVVVVDPKDIQLAYEN